MAEFYDHYLRSPYWTEKRRDFLTRRPVCEDCEKLPSVLVHHLKYNLYREVEDDVVCLCTYCHLDRHGLNTPAEYNRYIDRLKREGKYGV